MKKGRKTGLSYWLLAAVGAAGAGYFAAAILRLRQNPRSTAFMRLRQREAEAAGRMLPIHHEWIALTDLPPHVSAAVILSTDQNFFQHYGVDWARIWRVWKTNREHGGLPHGGSTITVQTAKNLYFHPRRTYWRKIAEVPVAYAMELLLGKKRVLEIYLNIAEWGDGVFGIEAAAQHHFGKSARDLTIPEVSLLAAVIPNPRRWSPTQPTLYIHGRASAIRRAILAQISKPRTLAYRVC